jgi:solute carrier family 25 (mitochondrial adenine nucleotide translocator), member 4/5/6/31
MTEEDEQGERSKEILCFVVSPPRLFPFSNFKKLHTSSSSTYLICLSERIPHRKRSESEGLSQIFSVGDETSPQATMTKKRARDDDSSFPQQWKDAVAGAGAGAFSKTMMAPIERIKLILQLQGSLKNHQHYNPHQNARQVAYHVYKEEGIVAFWRGNLPNVLRTAGQAALNFALMDHYKQVVNRTLPVILPNKFSSEEESQRAKKLASSFLSGGLAGGTATTILYPVEFLRTRLAMDQGRSLAARQYSGMGDVLYKTVVSDGVRGVYQGYGIALWGSVLYRLLHLGGYDALKSEWLLIKNSNAVSTSVGELTQQYSWAERFTLAQLVSLTAGTICYPIDSVRRRLMMQAGKAKEARLYRNSIHCFQKVFREEGFRGFYLGLAPNLVRSIGGALMLVAYDEFRSML